MLVVLLLISQISCDWVEISQNNYKKQPPLRATQSGIVRHEEKAQNNRNHSDIVNNHWNKAIIDRVTNVGNVKRVQDLSVKTPSMKTRPNVNVFYKSPTGETNFSNQRHQTDSEHSRLSIYEPVQDESKRIEITHREMTKLSNQEAVKRSEEIHNSVIKNIEKSTLQNPFNRNKVVIEKLNNPPNKGSGENNIYRLQDNSKHFDEDDIANEDRIHRISNNGRNKFHLSNNLSEKSNIFSTTSVPKLAKTDEIFRKGNIKHFHGIRNYDEDDLNRFPLNDYKFSNASIAAAPTFHNTRIDKIPFEHTDDRISGTDLSSTFKLESIPRVDLNTDTPEKKTYEHIQETNNEKDIINNIEQILIVPKADRKTVSGMWKLMKAVTDTIYKNTHRTFKSKIKYLEGLKTTILASIEEQIEHVWPDDVEHRGSRSRRAHSAQARGHVEFPSSESALMTISFLTFAVFLIKLVLQVIHTYKNKTMMMTPAVFAAVGRAVGHGTSLLTNINT